MATTPREPLASSWPYATLTNLKRCCLCVAALPQQSLCKPHTLCPFQDCDGVLVDTERDGHRVTFNQAFASKGTR